MRLGKDLENKPIISVADGRILGRAKDVYVNRDLSRLAGIFVGTEGVIRRKSLLIPSEDIVLLGIDVILVKDADVVTTSKALPEMSDWYRLGELQGQEVRTPGGTKLGTIGDVVLDEDGAVSAVALAKVFVTGPLAQNGLIPRDVVVAVFAGDDSVQVDLPKLESHLAGIHEEELPPAPEDEVLAAPPPSLEDDEAAEKSKLSPEEEAGL
jgi:sporulation protein YlmC with PRC-barrel domain